MSGKHRRESAGKKFAGRMFSVMLLGIVIAGAAALIVVPKLTGAMPLTVLTGSMRPTYAPGSIVVVRPTPVDELRVGDPITYQMHSDQPEVVTHRIISVRFVSDGSKTFITQGDANGSADPEPVKAEQIRGRGWYSVPYVGYVSTALSGENHDLVIRGLAGGLLLYGGFLVMSGQMERRRTQQLVMA